MDSMDNVQERIEVLEQRTEQLKHQTLALAAHTRTVERRRRWWRGIACGMALLGLLSLGLPSGQAADLACVAGDVACLIDAINQANTNGEANTIRLEAGTYTFTAPDNGGLPDGNNGLPVVTGIVTIQGAGVDATILEANGFCCRLAKITATGNLTIDRLTIRRFDAGARSDLIGAGGFLNRGGVLTLTNSRLTEVGGGIGLGGCIYSSGGTLTLAQTTLTGCTAGHGGGIVHDGGGPFLLLNSTVEYSGAGTMAGGILTSGGLTMVGSTLRGNQCRADVGGLLTFGTVAITESTIADNHGGTAGGIENHGALTIINSTIAHNSVTPCSDPLSCNGFGGEEAAAIVNQGITAIVLSSTIADNQALEH
jgi:hypothetical protein